MFCDNNEEMEDDSEREYVPCGNDEEPDTDSASETEKPAPSSSTSTQSYQWKHLSLIPRQFCRVTGFTVTEFNSSIYPRVAGVLVPRLQNYAGKKRKLCIKSHLVLVLF